MGMDAGPAWYPGPPTAPTVADPTHGQRTAAASRAAWSPVGRAAGRFCAVEETDRAIVAALTADGRLSYTDLAERVGLSVSAVHQRVRRLEQRGVINGYAARVAYDAIDLPLTAFVAIRPLDPSQPDDARTGWPTCRRSTPATRWRGRTSTCCWCGWPARPTWSGCCRRSARRPTSRPARRWCCPRRTRAAHPKIST